MVIFDKKSSIKIDMLNDFMDKVVTTHPIVEDYLVPNIGDKASCIMLKLDGKTNADNHFLLSKRDHSIDLSISDYNIKTTNIDIISRPFDVVTPRLEFNIENLKNTSLISFVDPIVGDKIHVLATNNVQYNIENAHSFIDLDIMKSIQGIVIREKSDNLQLNKSDVLFWITSKSGLNISSKYGVQKDINFFQKPGFFRLQQFQSKSGILTLKPCVKILAQLKKIETALQKQLYDSSQDDEYNIRTNLALLYLANDYLPEATAHLEYSYNFSSPLLRKKYDFLLLYAVAKFMEGHFQNARKIVDLIDISSVPIRHIEEVKFWQNIISISNNNPVYLKHEFIDKFFKKNGSFLENYPQNILSKIKFFAIEYLLENKKYDLAEATIKLLSTFDLNREDEARLYYEKANLYEQTTEDHKAIVESLSQCVNIDNSLYYNSLCKLKMTNIQLKNKDIDLSEAIKQLQFLDLDTRNSKLEIKVLERLASLFYDNKDYINALLTWRTVFDYYPYSIQSLSITNNMTTTFVDIFLSDLGNYTSFQKVAIFDEFSDLNPIGGIGDKVALKLSDSLVDLDLLKRASRILEHQVKYRLYGFAKEEALNRLLQLYLELNQPESILKLVKQSRLDDLPDQIKNTRQYIYAKALAKEKQYKVAVKILKNDISNEADTIRANIYWKTQNWEAFNDNSEPYIYSLILNDLPLTAEDVKKILMQSLSYSFLNKTDLLTNLFNNFKKKLLEKHKDIFDIMGLLIKLQYQEKNKANVINTKYIQEIISNIYNRMNSELLRK